MTIPFESGEFYHVYNHANGNEKLFQDNEHCRFFLTRFKNYLSDITQIYAWCLIPNHFHFLIKVRDITNPDIVSEEFRKFFISYSKAVNKQLGRKGSLFEKNLKRIKIEKTEYLIWLIYYIHRNPFHHGMIKDFREYTWSSYKSLTSDKNTTLARNEVWELFGSKELFINFHNKNHKLDSKLMGSLILE